MDTAPDTNPGSARSVPRELRSTIPSALTILPLALPLAFGSSSPAVEPDPSALPPAADREVSFTQDILPILEAACLNCHGAERPRSGFRLDNRASALAGGDLGVDIIPGDSAASPLIHFVARLVDGMEMPPRGDPLTTDEIALLRAWIDQGAPWADTPTSPRIQFSVTPSVRFITVSGNAARFREHEWMREGWGGGATEFSLEYDLDPRTRLEFEGAAIAGDEAYRFSARIERDDLGWARFAYRESRRFHDDTGGYYEPFGIEAPELHGDLHVRRRQVALEFGLELPNWPVIRIGYDLHLRDGTESTLHWGALSRGNTSRNILPARKHVDETTHRVSLAITDEWGGFLVSNEAELEWHDQDNVRFQTEISSPGFDFATRARDRQDFWRGANILRIERRVRDWLYLSGGYLYSQLKDRGGFSVTSLLPSDPSAPPSLDIVADNLTLRRRSHVFNANSMLGPWRDLHFYAGVQAEWTRQEGFASGRTFGIPTAYDSSVDRNALEEHFGLRYAGIPNAVLFVESRFQQESHAHFEEGLAGDQQAFLRDTDADGDLKDVEAGFSVSPWRQVSLHAKYRRRHRSNDYDHPRDMDLLASGNGYPAFILERETVTDEFEARVAVRPLRWVKATLRYSFASSEFETTTAPWEAGAAAMPRASIRAGEHESHAVSAGVILTPWSRLHVSSSLSWSTSETVSGVNNGRQVVPYEGDVWSALQSATWILDEKTDILASYLYSHASFSQDNDVAGLPLGIAFTRHVATAGIARRMKHDRLLRLEYAFFTYDEPTLGGAGDYTAHGFFASLQMAWP